MDGSSSATSTCIAAAAAGVLLGVDRGWARVSAADTGALVLLAYLLTYLLLTSAAFAAADTEQVCDWARREDRGTVLQRYVLGTAPGPGVSTFIAAAALLVAMVWLPGHVPSELGRIPRISMAFALVAVAWVCVAVAFAVSFQADNLVEDERGLGFPGEQLPVWGDYVYFAFSLMTTFGTTDVVVLSREMRRTVTVNSVVAFVFNTVTVASVVSALNSG
ncbi:DUF1345 domain-containing protein [Streptomyces sp. NPDC058045]|uniref:DUF1345 domain-containing protein n=1 Tax=Streptomyces sp. NPDC058045 TaxID=3346311 RepID=UPI0036E89893